MAPPQDRDKALDAALTQIDRQFGKGSVMRLGDDVRAPIEVPAMMSGRMPASLRARSTPICAQPRAEPLPSASPMRGRVMT